MPKTMAFCERTGLSNATDPLDDLEAWREVHATLLQAVRKAQEAVDMQKAQRRYWLEEIAWNLSEDGCPTGASAWLRPVPVIKSSLKKGAHLPASLTTASSKRKKKGGTTLEETGDHDKPAKKPRKKKDDEEVVKKSKKAKSLSPAWQQRQGATPHKSPDAAETGDRAYPPPAYPDYKKQQPLHSPPQNPLQPSWGADPAIIAAAAQNLHAMVRC